MTKITERSTKKNHHKHNNQLQQEDWTQQDQTTSLITRQSNTTDNEFFEQAHCPSPATVMGFNSSHCHWNLACCEKEVVTMKF